MDKRDEKIAMALCSSLGIPTWRGNMFIIADRLSQARSQAYEECAKIAQQHAEEASLSQKEAFDQGRDRAGDMFFAGQNTALSIVYAIRQHSQKGGEND